MKKTQTILILMAVLCTIGYYGCKKSTDDPAPAPPNPVGSPNYLCDGNGHTTYYPLDSTDTWTYSYKIFGVNQSSPHLTVTGHANYGGHKYAVITDATHIMYNSAYYLREDSVSHDIINFNDNNSQAYLEVPNAPVLNQDWNLQGVAYHKTVTNLSASITTASCTYSGLLEITEYNGPASTTNIVTKFYYKKGLGLVYRLDPGSLSDEYAATAATLH